MKTLKDFIKESQEINEGLLGDIVRKLLDTGLSWIEGSVKWIANKSTDAVGEIWKTHRDVLTTTYSDFRRTYPQYKFLPETPKTPREYAINNIAIFFEEDVKAEHKIDYANDLIAKFKRKERTPGSANNLIVDVVRQCYVGIIKNPKAIASDKAKADNFLNNVKSSVDDDTAKLIDSNIKHYIAEI